MTEQTYGFLGQRVLVTGGSRGIGLALARRLVNEGAQVAICGRKESNLEAAQAQLGGEVLCVAAHVAKADQVDHLFEEIERRFAGIDVVINNVGMNLPAGPLAETDPALWQKIIDSNLNGTFLVTRRAVQLMKKGTTGGAIVTVSSTAAHKVSAGMGIYGIAKSALEMMTKVLAVELAEAGIRVNAVAPGMVKTEFSKPFWDDPQRHDAIVATIPRGQLAEPDEIVHPVLFLASRGAAHITGQTLVVDGGAGI